MGGSSIGILFGAQALGAAAGPLIAGMVADRQGLLATFYFLAATIVVANLFVVFTPRVAAEA
jgi:predicted MFS family arabinose efflux permease